MVRIIATNLTVVRSERRLLHDISLEFGSVGSTAIIGPNGAGKSTLLKTLAGLIKPAGGAVSIDGTPLQTLDRLERARTIGYMPQVFDPHWDIQVVDLLRISLERAERVSGEKQLSEVVALHGLQQFQQRWWSTLSGGERARILLAMIVAVRPPVLLADEPSASLDPRYRLELVERIAEHGKSGIAIVVMHDLDLAFRFFDRVILLDEGRVRADGPSAELFDQTIIDKTFGVEFIRSSQDGMRTLVVGRPEISFRGNMLF